MHIRALITFRNMFMCRKFQVGYDSAWTISDISAQDVDRSELESILCGI